MPNHVDALLVLSVGGPESREDVYPFLERISGQSSTGIPARRLASVAERYFSREGVSPANQEIRKLIQSLHAFLNKHRINLPIYQGNRFSHPFVTDAVAQMKRDGIKHALALATSAFGSEFSCWNYRKAVEEARERVGPSAPRIKKLRLFFNHPSFIHAWVERFQETICQQDLSIRKVPVLFTAHSLPEHNPTTPLYEEQVRESCSLVAKAGRIPHWNLAFQSRSGPPSQSWLGPDIFQVIRDLFDRKEKHLIVLPIGFIVDNMEIVYDLDEEAAEYAAERGIKMIRAKTIGDHPLFLETVHKLILEQSQEGTPREFLGRMGAADDDCNFCLCPKN